MRLPQAQNAPRCRPESRGNGWVRGHLGCMSSRGRVPTSRRPVIFEDRKNLNRPSASLLDDGFLVGSGSLWIVVKSPCTSCRFEGAGWAGRRPSGRKQKGWQSPAHIERRMQNKTPNRGPWISKDRRGHGGTPTTTVVAVAVGGDERVGEPSCGAVAALLFCHVSPHTVVYVWRCLRGNVDGSNGLTGIDQGFWCRAVD